MSSGPSRVAVAISGQVGVFPPANVFLMEFVPQLMVIYVALLHTEASFRLVHLQVRSTHPSTDSCTRRAISDPCWIFALLGMFINPSSIPERPKLPPSRQPAQNPVDECFEVNN